MFEVVEVSSFEKKGCACSFVGEISFMSLIKRPMCIVNVIFLIAHVAHRAQSLNNFN